MFATGGFGRSFAAALAAFAFCVLAGPWPLAARAAGAPPGSATVVDQARAQVASGNVTAAIAQLVAYLGAHPRELEVERYLGDLYYRSGDLASAERTYLDILRTAPGDRPTHDRLGGLYASQDRISDAIAQFEASLPASDAYEQLVALHERRGDLPAFVASYERAASERPDDAAALYAIGTIYAAIHRTSEAVSAFERALENAPQSCPILSALGGAYLDQHRPDQASGVLDRCLEIDADNYPALVNRGDAEIDLNRNDVALRDFQHANRVEPDGAAALVDLGYLRDVAGDRSDAMSFYTKALAADPFSREAYIDLGFDYAAQGLDALAEASYLKGLSVAPQDGRLHYLLGALYEKMGKRDLARSQYNLAAKSTEPEIASAAAHELASLQ
ncbi:MAG: tetratricopeptide repeat protein [Vulcanimicrobiaceae bacterium]